MLLHLAVAFSRDGGPPVRAVHVHHGLLAEADEWLQACQQTCEALSVNLDVRRVEVSPDGSGVEAAARRARYQAFRDVLQAGEHLLLAHHADDQVETVLQRLFRGAGPLGLAGMPASRPLGSGQLVRPLLQVRRTAIEAWAAAEGLKFVEDPSNGDHRYDRGFLRGEILPRLAQRWPGYRETVGRAAQLQAQWLGERAKEPFEVVQTALGEPCLLLVDEQTPEALATATHEWLTNMGWLSPSLRRLREFARQCLESRDDRCPQLSLNGAVLRCWRRMVILSGMAFDPAIFPDTVVVGEAQGGDWGSLGWQPAGPGYGFAPGTQLSLRCRRPGEKVPVRGRKSQDFGQLCQAAGLPPWWRDQLPLFMLGGEPVFMAGLGRLGGQVLQPDSDGFCPVWLPPQPLP